MKTSRCNLEANIFESFHFVSLHSNTGVGEEPQIAVVV